MTEQSRSRHINVDKIREKLPQETLAQFVGSYSFVDGRPSFVMVANVLEKNKIPGLLYSGKVPELYRGKSGDIPKKQHYSQSLRRVAVPNQATKDASSTRDTDILVRDKDFDRMKAAMNEKFGEDQVTTTWLSPAGLTDEPTLANSACFLKVTVGEDTFEIKAGSDGVMGDFRFTDKTRFRTYNVDDVPLRVVPEDTILIKLLRFNEEDINHVATLVASSDIDLDKEYVTERAEEMGILPQIMHKLYALDLLPSPVQRAEIPPLSDEEVRSYPELQHIQEAEQNINTERRAEIRQLVKNMIPEAIRNHTDAEVRKFAEFTVNVCTTALVTELYHYGDSHSFGKDYLDNQRNTLPTTYHNLEGSLFAMLGAAVYMEWDKSILDKKSEYANPHTYLATMITAAFDDIHFSGSRGADETKSSDITEKYLSVRGVHSSIVRLVRDGVKASEYDEVTGGTRKADMRNPVQRASVIGDVLHMATAWGTLRFCALVMENMYRDFGIKKHGKQGPIAPEFEMVLHDKLAQIPDHKLPKNSAALVALINKDPNLIRAVATSLKSNKVFLEGKHKFLDESLQRLVQQDKVRNGEKQAEYGEKMLPFEDRTRFTFADIYLMAWDEAWEKRNETEITLPQYLEPVYRQLLTMSVAGIIGANSSNSSE